MLPGRQLVAASAPGGPGDQEGAPARPGQLDALSVRVGQPQVGGELAALDRRTPWLAEDCDRLLAVDLDGQCTAQSRSELREGQRLAQRSRATDVVAAEPVVRGLPTAGLEHRLARQQEIVAAPLGRDLGRDVAQVKEQDTRRD
jgi:hypothetical protein